MSRIQDLLAKQKGTTGNETAATPQHNQVTSQSPTGDTNKPNGDARKTEETPKSSLLQKLGKKAAQATTGEVKNGVVSPAINNSISGPNSAGKSESETRSVVQQAQQQRVEQKPEPEETAKESPQAKPLSLMQRRLLESKKNVQNNPPSVSVGTSVQPSGKKEETHSVVLADSPQLSASQSADAQKINDGAANIEELKRNLAYLANNIDNKDLVAQIVRTIALQIKNNTELQPHMTNADVNLMVRGLRMSYQVAAMNKQAKADDRAAKGRKASEVDNIFKDAGIDFNFKF